MAVEFTLSPNGICTMSSNFRWVGGSLASSKQQAQLQRPALVVGTFGLLGAIILGLRMAYAA